MNLKMDRPLLNASFKPPVSNGSYNIVLGNAILMVIF